MLRDEPSAPRTSTSPNLRPCKSKTKTFNQQEAASHTQSHHQHPSSPINRTPSFSTPSEPVEAKIHPESFSYMGNCCSGNRDESCYLEIDCSCWQKTWRRYFWQVQGWASSPHQGQAPITGRREGGHLDHGTGEWDTTYHIITVDFFQSKARLEWMPDFPSSQSTVMTVWFKTTCQSRQTSQRQRKPLPSPALILTSHHRSSIMVINRYSAAWCQYPIHSVKPRTALHPATLY